MAKSGGGMSATGSWLKAAATDDGGEYYFPQGGATEVRLRRKDTSVEAMKLPITRTFVRHTQTGANAPVFAALSLTIEANKKVSTQGTGDGASGAVVLVGRPSDDKTLAVTDNLLPVEFERSVDTRPPDRPHNWQAMTGQLTKVLPGQIINLRVNAVNLPSNTGLSDFEWVLPSKTFKNYTANQQSGKVEPWGPNDMKYTEISFYFADSGTKEVRIKCNHSGKPVEFAVTITVDKPVGSITTKNGVTLKKPGSMGDVVQLAPNGNSKEGIDFDGKATLPPGWPPGKWNWIQLVTMFRVFSSPSGSTVANPKNGQLVLDTTYPYSPRPIGSHPADEVGATQTGSSHLSGDSPFVELLPIFSSVTINHHFQMYLMFKPDGVESRYVPLSRLDWIWLATASNNGGVWTVPATDPVIGQPTETSSHPTWLDNAK